MSTVFVATVQLAIKDADADSVADFLSEFLGSAEGILDWSYLRFGGQMLYPTERYIAEDYQEGDVFA